MTGVIIVKLRRTIGCRLQTGGRVPLLLLVLGAASSAGSEGGTKLAGWVLLVAGLGPLIASARLTPTHFVLGWSPVKWQVPISEFCSIGVEALTFGARGGVAEYIYFVNRDGRKRILKGSGGLSSDVQAEWLSKIEEWKRRPEAN